MNPNSLKTRKTERLLLPATIGLAFVLLTTAGSTPSAGESETTQWAAEAVATSSWISNPDNNPSWDPIYGPWSAAQATGAPDTYPRCGDIMTAWAPLIGSMPIGTEDEPEALTVIYDPPVDSPGRVDIYETNIGGFVTRVDVIGTTGATTVFEEADPTPCPGILSVPLTDVGIVVGVTIHTKVFGWEEIDAVALVS